MTDRPADAGTAAVMPARASSPSCSNSFTRMDASISVKQVPKTSRPAITMSALAIMPSIRAR